MEVGPVRSRLAPEKFLEVRFQRNEMDMAKMGPWGPFISHCIAWAARRTLYGCRVYLAHIQRPPINIDRLTFDKKYLKKPKVSCLVPWTKLENFSEPAIAAQPCQVKPVLIHEQHSFRTQFWGNKMQNCVIYSIPLIALEISNKEGAAVDIVFYLPLICMPNLENSKNITFSP